MMCQQNLPKLWCRYEFIFHNYLRNSEIVPQWIQQEISKKVTVTDSVHHLFAVRNLILRCLTGSHMTILSKSNYRVILNVNMNIHDSVSFYFNFGKGYHFVLRLKQHFFDKAQFFQMNRVNPTIDDWREKEVETCTRCSLSFERCLGKTKSVR